MIFTATHTPLKVEICFAAPAEGGGTCVANFYISNRHANFLTIRQAVVSQCFSGIFLFYPSPSPVRFSVHLSYFERIDLAAKPTAAVLFSEMFRKPYMYYNPYTF